MGNSVSIPTAAQVTVVENTPTSSSSMKTWLIVVIVIVAWLSLLLAVFGIWIFACGSSGVSDETSKTEKTEETKETPGVEPTVANLYCEEVEMQDKSGRSCCEGA